MAAKVIDLQLGGFKHKYWITVLQEHELRMLPLMSYPHTLLFSPLTHEAPTEDTGRTGAI